LFSVRKGKAVSVCTILARLKCNLFPFFLDAMPVWHLAVLVLRGIFLVVTPNTNRVTVTGTQTLEEPEEHRVLEVDF
jgi:hypothetical protein